MSSNQRTIRNHRLTLTLLAQTKRIPLLRKMWLPWRLTKSILFLYLKCLCRNQRRRIAGRTLEDEARNSLISEVLEYNSLQDRRLGERIFLLIKVTYRLCSISFDRPLHNSHFLDLFSAESSHPSFADEIVCYPCGGFQFIFLSCFFLVFSFSDDLPKKKKKDNEQTPLWILMYRFRHSRKSRKRMYRWWCDPRVIIY